MVEFDAPGTFRLLRHDGRFDIYRCIEQFENALRRSHGRLQDVVFVAEILDGTEKTLRILRERNQDPQRGPGRNRVDREEVLGSLKNQRTNHDVLNRLFAAVPDNRRHGDCRENFYYWVVDRVSHNRVFEGDHVTGVNVGKLAEGALFAVEQLQHQHPGNGFLQVRVDPGDGDADAAVGVAHLHPEDHRRPKNQRQDCERDQGQLPIHPGHDRDDADQHKHVLEDGNDSGGEHFIQRVHVRRNARYETTHRILVIEADVHPLQMAENLAAQVEHHHLPGPLHVIGLEEVTQKTEHQGTHVQSG